MGKIKKIKEDRKRAEVEAQIKKMKRNRLFLRGILVLFALAALFAGANKGYKLLNGKWDLSEKLTAKAGEVVKMFKKDQTNTEVTTGRKTYTAVPTMQIDTKKTYQAQVQTTDGNFTITLNASDTPNTVNNFVVLSRDGFYNDTVFHRIIKDFMIQGGDPKGDGTGGPGYQFADEKFSGDYTPGTVAMANSGANTNGSQFFVMTGDYSGGKLPKSYTVFGKVTAGMDVIQKIAATPVKAGSSGENSTPTETVKILTITIEEK